LRKKCVEFKTSFSHKVEKNQRLLFFNCSSFILKTHLLKLKQVQTLFAKRTVTFKNNYFCYFYSRQTKNEKKMKNHAQINVHSKYNYTFL